MVLIVDDKKENLLSLQSLLVLHGFTVQTADSGESALKKVLKNDYALIILDVQMPGMDGFEVAEMLSGYSKMNDVPIIFLSAASKDKKFITKGYNSGAVDYITKPIDADIFLLKVNTLHKLYEQKRQLNEMQLELRQEIEYRKKAQQEMMKKTDQLVSVLESIPQIAFTTDTDGTIEFFNSKWNHYTVAPNTFPDTHPDDPALRDVISVMVESQSPVEQEIRIKEPDTNFYRYFLLRTVPMRKGEKVEQWVGTFTDIDEQKQVSKKKDEFISIASHELKTPLTSMKGYVQLLERTINEDSPGYSYVKRTLAQIKKLDKLIVDLLDVSKIESGSLRLNMTHFDLAATLSNCVNIMRQTFPEHTFTLKSQKDVTVYGDEERLEQVLLNFLSNAVKYSPVNKEVVVESSITDPGFVKICVTDFGVGIPKEEQSKVFEKFYRAAGSAGNFPGLGLGLYICADILQRHGATYGVKSEQDKGSTFYFSLPFTNQTTVLSS
jgi:signal transduction histidine kinase/DNA-binding response OmpR family regulator